jgi:hypothetical protein
MKQKNTKLLKSSIRLWKNGRRQLCLYKHEFNFSYSSEYLIRSRLRTLAILRNNGNMPTL